MEEVERHFAEHPSLSLRQAVPNVSVSMSTLHKILKYDMKYKFYCITSVQRLQDTHKEQQRRQFCRWLPDQDEDRVQKVIWTDEKIFVLSCIKNLTARMMDIAVDLELSIYSKSERMCEAVCCKSWRRNNWEGDEECLEARKTLPTGWRRPFSTPSVDSLSKYFHCVSNKFVMHELLVPNLIF